MRSCQTLEEFYSVVGGEEAFRSHVAEFDKMNEFLIQLYAHHLNTLSSYLSEEEKGLLEDLRPLTNILYWRKV
jgi:octaprenyl-diphosphate synthase